MKKNGENYEKHPVPPALVCFTCLIRISFYFCLLFRSILCSIPTPLRWQKYKAAFECVFGIQPTTHVDLREIISKVLRIKWVNFECTQFVRSIVETPPLSVASMSIVRATISRIPLYRSHPEFTKHFRFISMWISCLSRAWMKGRTQHTFFGDRNVYISFEACNTNSRFRLGFTRMRSHSLRCVWKCVVYGNYSRCVYMTLSSHFILLLASCAKRTSVRAVAGAAAYIL